MNVLIIEDEENLARQLKKLLKDIDPKIHVLSVMDSIQSSVDFIRQEDISIDLMLVDIYLSDGLSFEIFEQVECKSPVIFCTAYDQYALKAFELDSVDYLLKPIKKQDLKRAIDKYKRIFKEEKSGHKLPDLTRTIQDLHEKLSKERSYKKHFLLPHKDRLVPVSVSDIRYFHADYGMVKCVTGGNKLYPIDQSLDTLMETLDPYLFFRANRQFIVKREAILDLEYYFNGRLYLNLLPKPSESVIISKAKATEFKQWLSES